MAPGAKRVFALAAPPGFGKGFTLLELTRRLLETGPEVRVMILCPRMLSEQYLYRLRSAGAPCLFLDRYALRTLFDLGGCAKALPARCAVIAGYEFVRTQDVVQELAKISWSLVVGDEAERLSGSASDATTAAFNRLLEASARGLLIGQRRLRIVDAMPASSAESVEWTEKDLLCLGSDLTPNLINSHPVFFEQSAKELALVTMCHEFAKKLVLYGAHPQVTEWISRRVLIGVPVADEMLGRWERYGVMSARRSDEVEDPIDTELQIEERVNSRLVLTAELLLELRAIRTYISSIEVDSRLEELLRFLNQELGNSIPQQSIVVVVQSRLTAYYVASALRDFCEEVEVLHPGVEFEKMANLIANQGCSILVATTGVLKGLEFPNTDCLIIYDCEATSVQDRILARFDRFGRQTILNVVQLSLRENFANLAKSDPPL